ncbi:hypothetical protein JZ751_016996 [Albula glossodonta]|uniref:Uncharacterized protein n=1 Tax=Albula glossodonta TaxID=121402 RepID=A0A8T2MUS6_9TELE|nr:hypothetical protein JZ751_014074 [Albula glossodonta]KAG9331794.1 hypothetical protein JZ751_016996 [Albula glossodonta]
MITTRKSRDALQDESAGLLISLLAMPTYFVMIPCWFRPGSKRRKLAEGNRQPRQRGEAMVKRRLHQPPTLCWDFTRFPQISWKRCCCSVVLQRQTPQDTPV